MVLTSDMCCVFPQTVEESSLLLEGALSSVTSLLVVVLSKQFSSDNLHSIFKVYILIYDNYYSVWALYMHAI